MDVKIQEENFRKWAADNLGEKTGLWYAPYLNQFGKFIEELHLLDGKTYFENFFSYQNYQEFLEVYQEIIGATDKDITQILSGKAIRYPDTYAQLNLEWNQKYAQKTYDEGTRSKPDQFGGIPNLGSLFRAYLKFLYYQENPTLKYPKKRGLDTPEVDDGVNYWLYAPGEQSRLWDTFYKENTIGIGWDFLGELTADVTKITLEKEISKVRNDGKRPTNAVKVVWDFYNEMKPGDIVYVKDGVRKLIGKGTVIGEYYYDENAKEYKHRRKVNWTSKGIWDLKERVSMKTLTNINSYPDLISYFDQLVHEEKVEEKEQFKIEFKTWLSKQVFENGESLDDKTIHQKVHALEDLEKHYKIAIFGEKSTEILENLKETVANDLTYQRYVGVSRSAINYYIRYVESQPTEPDDEEFEKYSIENFLEEVFIEKEDILQIQSVLENKKNIILKGAPGVGKTYMADRLAYLMMEEKDSSRIQMVQFHQSYSYEDFIEGFRPKQNGEGFELKKGPFVKFARRAAEDPDQLYFFIIDEINRGNMSKIFGELMMLIEADKRGKSINLLYSNEKFFVPDNLYIIGMMNTADRSLALIDYALRRRFSFIEIEPVFDNDNFVNYIQNLEQSDTLLKAIQVIKDLNKVLRENLSSGFQIGHSYFIDEAYAVHPISRLKEVIEYEIIPQLHEYWFDDEDMANFWSEQLRGVYNGGTN